MDTPKRNDILSFQLLNIDSMEDTDYKHIYKKGVVVWMPMRQLSTRDQMTQKLTTIGPHTAFNNEHSQYCMFKREN